MSEVQFPVAVALALISRSMYKILQDLTVEDAVADSTVAVDIRMVDRCMETALRRECRVVAFHV